MEIGGCLPPNTALLYVVIRNDLDRGNLGPGNLGQGTSVSVLSKLS